MSDGDAGRHEDKRDAEVQARKREAVLSYWGAVVKDDRKLCKFNLGDLERKMFSWSVQDIFNRDLLKQQVTYR
jgi:senataxin